MDFSRHTILIFDDTKDTIDLMTEFVGDPTGIQIRAMVDEINHSIFHLNRSNEELQEFPEDSDCVQAIAENKGVLLKKRGTIKSYLALLNKVDPAYQQEHAAELMDVFIALSLSDVNEIPLPGEYGYRNPDADSLTPIEVYQGGARQLEMESRLLTGITGAAATNAADTDTAPPFEMNAGTTPDIVDVDQEGMYL